MLLNRTTEMAIQCVVHMAQSKNDRPVVPQELAESFSISKSYTSKILRRLAKHGILESYRGASGGFRIKRDPSEITLLEIVEICQGVITGNYCEEMDKPAVGNTCGYHQAMYDVECRVKEALADWTIARIMKSPPPGCDIAPKCKLRRLSSTHSALSFEI